MVKIKDERKKREYKDKESIEKSFTAYIVRGNRQVVKRQITASKKFTIGGDTYIIKSDCIFLKNEGGHLHSYSYYVEGNPNPFNFEDRENMGITERYLNDLYAGDFLFILLKAQKENRMKFIAIIVVLTFALTVANFGYTMFRLMI